MRVAVAGATGRIGRLTLAALERAGHQPVAVSRRAGVDAYTGTGLDAALREVSAVIDATSTSAREQAEVVDFFATITRNLLAAGERAGVQHHVLLSIVGIDHGRAVAHYAGKREQERLVTSGPVPWTIVRATQFHDFAAMTAEWAGHDGVATIAPLLVQPIAPADVAAVLAEIAVAAPLRARMDIAGPETQDLVDMARRTFAARGKAITLVPTWRGIFGPGHGRGGPAARRGCPADSVTFADWLAAGAQ